MQTETYDKKLEEFKAQWREQVNGVKNVHKFPISDILLHGTRNYKVEIVYYVFKLKSFDLSNVEEAIVIPS